ncbi:hypothetical protein ACPV3A_09780 [Paenibacillus sp. Dod16]|uniref:hypothetical protein n=1 Tax=Paenibacillus sp. Dod16 TaxID=3416392 RepID=UPI003CEE2092
MLKMVGVESTINKVDLEIDKYVPFNIEWNYTTIKNPKNYWRTGDFNRSLFAIGLDSVTGLIRDMTLTSFNKISESDGLLLSSNSVVGLPKFDLTQWPSSDSFLDYSRDFIIHLTRNGISISMIPDSVALTVKSERVLFHFDENNILLTVDIIDFTEDEYQRIRMSLT